MNNESPKTPIAAQQHSSSTGPRTTAGKAVSSRNARKHDLCSRTLRLSPEEWEEYNEMAARYRRDLQPASDLEHTLIDEICFNYWRLQQARDVELRIILEHSTELPIISLYIRYRTGYERAFYKALDKLQATQRIRKQEASKAGSVRSETAPKAATAQVPPTAVPPSPVRSAEGPAGAAELEKQMLEEEIQDHLLENRVRAQLCLPPLPLLAELSQKLNQFVSKNPGVLSPELLAESKKAA